MFKTNLSIEEDLGSSTGYETQSQLYQQSTTRSKQATTHTNTDTYTYTNTNTISHSHCFLQRKRKHSDNSQWQITEEEPNNNQLSDSDKYSTRDPLEGNNAHEVSFEENNNSNGKEILNSNPELNYHMLKKGLSSPAYSFQCTQYSNGFNCN